MKHLSIPTPYAIVIIIAGALLLHFGSGSKMLRSASASDARGKIDSLEYKISKLEHKIDQEEKKEDTDSKRIERYEDDVTEIKDEDLPQARLAQQKAEASATNGKWFATLFRIAGSILVTLGLAGVALGNKEEQESSVLRGLALLALVLFLVLSMS